MAVYIRLDDAVRARLRGAASGSTGSTTSSGSEHDASACLSGLVQAFLETENSAALEEDHPAPKGSGAADDDGSSASAAAAAAATAMRELLDPPAAEDPFRIRLAAAVSAALEAEGSHGHVHGAALRRAMVRRLRAAGYDAGVCKSRWEASGGGLTAGAHEYVDVVFSPSAAPSTRYIVDPEFRAGMEVARATAEYAAVVAAVPSPAVVAREESLGRAVRVAADAARRSLRAQGLHVPPWRKSRYMLAKWLGPYKRSPASTASTPATAVLTAAPAGMMVEGVKCRAVGFFPPAAAAARIR